eukprot:TRINITY_DN30382_c0_g1_i1.p1 TRINITY_DN30382_c0_g1~~TRINITY_DN30382_c0_g1_i1.p1  ORF type:complete len:1734 (+),score=270.87 TRINITY_DN30382_c0_g1_i1:59-5260(+)
MYRKVIGMAFWRSKLVALAALVVSATANSARPNFVIIQAEGTDVYDFWGDTYLSTQPGKDADGNSYTGVQKKASLMPNAPTPHMDRLRAEGAFFSRGYVASPKCTPGRHSLLTGRYPSTAALAKSYTDKTFGVSSGTAFPVKVGELETSALEGDDQKHNLQTALKDAGYLTQATGKYHLWAGSFPPKGADPNDVSGMIAQVRAALAFHGFTDVNAYYHSNTVEGAGQNLEWMVNSSLEYMSLAIAQGKNFLVFWNPSVPNSPDPTPELVNASYWGVRTPYGQLPEFPTVTQMPARATVVERAQKAATDAGARSQDYGRFAAVVWLDDAVGAVVKYLEEAGVLNSTVILFTADHAAEDKGEVYEGGSHVPFIIRYPPSFQAGVYDNVVSNLDVVPTFLELAGISPNFRTDGTNLVKLMENPTSWAERLLVTELGFDRAVQSKKFRYIYKPKGSLSNDAQQGGNIDKTLQRHPSFQEWQQFYDLEADIRETTNLINDTKHSAIISQYRSFLHCHQNLTQFVPRTQLMSLGGLSSAAAAAMQFPDASCNSSGGGSTLVDTGPPAEFSPASCVAEHAPPTGVAPDNWVKRNLCKFAGPKLRQPQTVDLVDGGSVELSVEVARVAFEGFANITSRVYSMTGLQPGPCGPTWIMHPGAKTDVILHNLLGPNPMVEGNHNTFRHINTTNLHTHGLHIDPEVDSVFVQNLPGQTHTYKYDLPAHHAPGTHWYHSHVHGASTLHVMGGLMGALVVEPATSAGPLLPGSLAQAPRTWMLLSHLKLDTVDDFNGDKNQEFQFETISYQWLNTEMKGAVPPDPAFENPGIRDAYVVNGQYQPQLALERGSFQVFHLINGGSGGHALELEILDELGTQGRAGSCRWWILGMDGVYFEAPREKTGGFVTFVQAGRLDLAVRCDAVGRFFLQSNGEVSRSGGLQPDLSRYTQNLVTLNVVEHSAGTSASPQAMPDSLVTEANRRPDYLKSLLENVPNSGNSFEISVDNTDREAGHFLMGVGSNCMLPCGGGGACKDPGPSFAECPHLVFDGQQGDPTVAGFPGFYGHVARQGTVQQAVLNGRTGGNHPIHIHVNHFQVVKFEPPEGNNYDLSHWLEIGDWRDTIPAVPGRLTLRFVAADLPGEIILHCHILRHEDTGMMDSFYIVPPSVDPASLPNLVDNLPCRTDELNLTAEEDTDFNILASKGFAFFTGGVTQDAWMPPGKTAVYFGFQYFRYQDSGAISSSDARKVGAAVAYKLDAAQRSTLCSMIDSSASLYQEIHALRAEIVSRIHDLRQAVVNGSSNDLAKTRATSEVEIGRLSQELYARDGAVADLYGTTFAALNLTAEQRKYFYDLWNGAAYLNSSDVASFKGKDACSKDQTYAQSNIESVASEIFAWVVGNDAWLGYIAEGKVANVFGFMRLRQEPRQEGSVSADRAGMASRFISALTMADCRSMASVVKRNINSMREYAGLHHEIARELKKLLDAPGNYSQHEVAKRAKLIGALEGSIVASQATVLSNLASLGSRVPAYAADWTKLRYPEGHPGAIFSACPNITVSPLEASGLSLHGGSSAGCLGRVPGQSCDLACAPGKVTVDFHTGRLVCYEFEGSSFWSSGGLGFQAAPSCEEPSCANTCHPSRGRCMNGTTCECFAGYGGASCDELLGSDLAAGPISRTVGSPVSMTPTLAPAPVPTLTLAPTPTPSPALAPSPALTPSGMTSDPAVGIMTSTAKLILPRCIAVWSIMSHFTLS